MIHKRNNKPVVIFFNRVGPPSSPPIWGTRRINMIVIAINAKTQNIVTENAKDPAVTSNLVPFMACLSAAIVHAIPMPKKTLTALLPVTLPTEESA